MEDDDVMSPILERRTMLKRAGTLGALGLGFAALRNSAAAATTTQPAVDGVDNGATTAQEDALLAAVCSIAPSATEGPYYLNLNLLRADITEGLSGLPMRLAIRVVRAADCTPIPNAVVDVWHCDRLGVYSGVAQQGTVGLTYLRGVSITNAGGIVRMDSIFPGWYPGRTTHIHVKVRPTASTELTTQLYFGDSISNLIYALPPYASHGSKNTLNQNDGIYTAATLMDIQRNPATGGIITGMTIGVA